VSCRARRWHRRARRHWPERLPDFQLRAFERFRVVLLPPKQPFGIANSLSAQLHAHQASGPSQDLRPHARIELEVAPCRRSTTTCRPSPESFATSEAYYSTLFHELGHSTGHVSRLARKEITDAILFGSHAYSREELVAEMCASFLSAQAGIERTTIENSAAYIAHWLKRLRDDRKLVVEAAGQAQKAADLILGKQVHVNAETGSVAEQAA
jgi:hypothetical protein